MAQTEIERVARAFYAAECDDDWDDASKAAREQYRNLARLAIALLKLQSSRVLPKTHPPKAINSRPPSNRPRNSPAFGSDTEVGAIWH